MSVIYAQTLDIFIESNSTSILEAQPFQMNDWIGLDEVVEVSSTLELGLVGRPILTVLLITIYFSYFKLNRFDKIEIGSKYLMF